MDEEATHRNEEVVLRAFSGGCDFSSAVRRVTDLDRLIEEWQRNCSKHHCYAAGDYWGNVRDHNERRGERDRLQRQIEWELVPCGFCHDCRVRMEAASRRVEKYISLAKKEQESCVFMRLAGEPEQKFHTACGQCKACRKPQERELQRWTYCG